MEIEQLRHWLAMHCPENVAGRICNELCDTIESGKLFYERHGFNPSVELARYVWADRMIEASKVKIVEAE